MQTRVEKILNIGQHAVNVIQAAELDFRTLMIIKSSEKVLGINNWIPYTYESSGGEVFPGTG